MQGRRKVYKIGGLPKARIIKFMNFNGAFVFSFAGGVRNFIERSSLATDLNFSGCHNINGNYASDLAGEE